MGQTQIQLSNDGFTEDKTDSQKFDLYLQISFKFTE